MVCGRSHGRVAKVREGRREGTGKIRQVRDVRNSKRRGMEVSGYYDKGKGERIGDE